MYGNKIVMLLIRAEWNWARKKVRERESDETAEIKATQRKRNVEHEIVCWYFYLILFLFLFYFVRCAYHIFSNLINVMQSVQSIF